MPDSAAGPSDATVKLIVPITAHGRRVDVYLTDALAGRFSRRQVRELLEEGKVLVNDRVAKPGLSLKEGDRVAGDLPAAVLFQSPAAESLPVRVIHEDAQLLVIDKPSGMVVHPGAGQKTGTLVNALLGRGSKLSSAGGVDRPGIVHRLDKDTSGVLVVAKSDEAHRKLQRQFEGRTLQKTYLALVLGGVEFEQGHIDKSLGRHPKMREKRAVSDAPGSRDALTRYKVLKRFAHATLLEVKPSTGRTHQIRVHLAHLGNAVVGDPIYGRPKPGERLALHAWKIELEHPKTGKTMIFEAPIPEDFTRMVDRYQKEKKIS